MAKVIFICGRLCSGKTTYARRLIKDYGGVLLSIDELMLSMFGQHCGEMHEGYAARAQRYLLERSLEIVAAGADVLLDWGLWKRSQRDRLRRFYAARNIVCETHLVRVDEAGWRERIEMRNRAVAAETEAAYFVDENLLNKFSAAYEELHDGEPDVIIM